MVAQYEPIEGSDKTVARLEKELKRLRRRKSGLRWGRLPALVPPPDIVIDVGAAGGTKELYRAFPKSRLIAIEPLPEKRKQLDALVPRFGLEIHQCAVGAERTSLPFHVGDGSQGLSSFLKRIGTFTERIVETRTVEVYRLDDLVQPEGTIGLKIDAEGYERAILLGATRLMPAIEWIVAEVSMAPRFEDDPLFGGVYELLARQGFVFRDILSIVRQRRGDLRRIDAVFIKPHLMDYAGRALGADPIG